MHMLHLHSNLMASLIKTKISGTPSSLCVTDLNEHTWYARVGDLPEAPRASMPWLWYCTAYDHPASLVRNDPINTEVGESSDSVSLASSQSADSRILRFYSAIFYLLPANK